MIVESYISFWNTRDTAYFSVIPVDVDLAGLTVSVSPEVGMRVEGAYQVLKLWLNSDRPTRAAQQIFVYFMERAREQSEQWQDFWHVGVWDVRRSNIPLHIRTARDFELGLIGQVAAFLQIWNELEQQTFDIGE